MGGLAFFLREIFESDSGSDGGMMGSGMMGNTSRGDISVYVYMDMFNRHNEIKRVVEKINIGISGESAVLVPMVSAFLDDVPPATPDLF